MLPDLSHIFAKYEALAKEADAIFSHVSSKYPACVTCHKGCGDCCHALFDLSLVEAMYLNNAFRQVFPSGKERSQILENASSLDRKLNRAKRELYQAEKDGQKPEQIMAQVAEFRQPCALLTADNECLLYEFRPITCRLYGIPLAIGGKSHVCGLSNFDKGQEYPTVQLAKIQNRLEDLSREIGTAIKSRFDLADVYVPLSMALLTNYDDAYLGVGKPAEDD